MKNIIWEVQYTTMLPVIKHCKKCGKKREFLCSRQFRINAQRKYLDIWLIYKCAHCSTTWNATVYSRISPQTIDHNLLDRFHGNEDELVERYAMDSAFLQGNGVETELPQYSVMGEDFSWNDKIVLEIKSKYPMSVKVSAVVRGKLGLSQKEYVKLVSGGRIRSIPEQDLLKCKLRDGIVLLFE